MHPYIVILTIALFTTSNLLTAYLYFYPIAQRCSFPEQPAQLVNGETSPSTTAPFRLLVFGDPQLEGSSSFVNPNYIFFPNARSLWQDWKTTPGSLPPFLWPRTKEVLGTDLPRFLRAWRKRVDLFGNDFYLAHIYRTLHWFTRPSHMTVLGDLLGSQWIDDAEFESRARRYWGRVFAGARKVEDELTNDFTSQELGADDAWSSRVINIAGNHDIGYSGDVTEARLSRFERAFGKANWEIRFTMPVDSAWTASIPELRLLVLNSLNIDGPVLDQGLQGSTIQFLADLRGNRSPLEDTTSSTVLLTHLPLHKDAGVCVDPPSIKYYPEDRGGTLREQNHLSSEASAELLSNIYGLGDEGDTLDQLMPSRRGIILTGHDHEGCDVWHSLPTVKDESGQQTWQAERWNGNHTSGPGIREITLRSMMGDFGGNAGLLSAWFSLERFQWEFAFAACPLGKQHFWWAVHILDIIAVVICPLVAWRVTREAISSPKAFSQAKEKTQ